MDDFWDSRAPVLSSECSNLFTDYARIHPEDLNKHIQAIRAKAWQVKQYPCIGSYMFLDLSMAKHPAYPTILATLQSDPTTKLLDLGCCIGQDLRKLAHDGVPGKQLAGYDIEPRFFDVGYEAFLDDDGDTRQSLDANFVTGDFLAAEEHPLRDYDFIHAADFFHLWSWKKQAQVRAFALSTETACDPAELTFGVEAYAKALLMLKDRPGCVLFGRSTGVEKARLLDEGPFARLDDCGDYTWLHDGESMRRMIGQVARSVGRRYDVLVEETRITNNPRLMKVRAVEELGWNRRLVFTIRTR